jgi:ABC-type transport system involved in multi-copper enzyme maturation permease subunit
VEDRTLIYLTLKPVSRLKIVIAKNGPAACVAAATVLITTWRLRRIQLP